MPPEFTAIELNNRSPKFRQIEDHIVDLISEGRLSPGDRLPAEKAMASYYGCARQTVRQALQELRANKWIETRDGVGSFVDENPPKQPP